MRKNHPNLVSEADELRESHVVGKYTREWMLTRQMSPTLYEHGIFLCGWSEARYGFNFVRPRFPMSQVLVCVSGVGEVWLDGAWQECGPGQAYLTPSHIFHAYRARPSKNEEDSVWLVYWLTYHTPMVEGKRPLLVRVDPEPISAAIRNLYTESHSVADRDTLARWTHLVHTCAERIVRPASGDPRLHRLWEVVMAMPDRAWDIPLLAEQLGISDEHLRRLCQKEVGCSPMKHVTHLRMQYAIALFTSGRYSVSAVAERVGYSSPFAFSAAFNRIFGIPPSQYVDTKLHPSG